MIIRHLLNSLLKIKYLTLIFTLGQSNLKFTIFCYENDIATSSLNVIENGYSQAYFSKIAKVIQALDMSYEEFGKLLDEYISKDFFKTD